MKKNEFVKLGRWVTPVLEYEAWLDWCDTLESREIGIVPDSINLVVIDGNHLLPKYGVYSRLVEKTLGEFRVGKYETAKKILEIAERIIQESRHLSDLLGPKPSIKQFFDSFELICRIRFPWNALFALGDAADEQMKFYAKDFGMTVEELACQIPHLNNSLINDQRMLLKFKQQIEKKELPFNSQKLLKKDPTLVAQISRYQNETEFIGTHHFWGQPRAIENLMNAIKSVNLIESKKIIPPKEFKEFFHIVALVTKYKFECNFGADRLQYKFRDCLTSYAKEFNLTYEDITYLTTEEIQKLDIKKIEQIKIQINKRKKAYGIFKEDGIIKITVDEELEQQIKFFDLNISHKDISEIKGNVASKGFARNIVAIVLTPRDNDKVKSGMVLVAPETTPDFVPAMARAGAFVTDIGGITSHAGIIAREMNKPCITGTKIATQVLKDGDLVEVDGERGIVRILSKNYN